jgi:hypothetical protein
MTTSPTRPLVCPRCATPHGLDERFCPDCGMPLVYAGQGADDVPVTAAHERARKVKKQYLDGDLVSVASALNLAEAELIQGILLEEGVPSMLRRSRGFDVPDMLAAGPRDILVPAGGALVAREVLLQSDIQPGRVGGGAVVDRPARILGGLVAALVVVGLILWIGTLIIG